MHLETKDSCGVLLFTPLKTQILSAATQECEKWWMKIFYDICTYVSAGGG